MIDKRVIAVGFAVGVFTGLAIIGSFKPSAPANQTPDIDLNSARYASAFPSQSTTGDPQSATAMPNLSSQRPDAQTVESAAGAVPDTDQQLAFGQSGYVERSANQRVVESELWGIGRSSQRPVATPEPSRPMLGDDNAYFPQSPPSGAIDVNSGRYLAPAGSGYVDPRNGTYYIPSGPDGVIDSRTGEYAPVSH